MTQRSPEWYHVSNPEEIESPSMLFYSERIQENVRRMVRIANGPERLRPHLKTHKTAELLRMQMGEGIRKFKCATVAEAEMAADSGVSEILLAYQPVGPNVGRFLELIRRFPATKFAALFDDEGALASLSAAAKAANLSVALYLDFDCGQHRSGVSSGNGALELYCRAAGMPGIQLKGLHAYDGHIHDSNPQERKERCDAAFEQVLLLKAQIGKAGLPTPHIIAGGTPTFPIHAQRSEIECSPGTCVLWDYGYASKLPDMDFLPAAMVLTRVVSKPERNRLCLDLGHKAIAAENPHPRVFFPDLPDAKPVTHSEEHLVLETPRATEFSVGSVLYGMPWHVCPTVALYSHAIAITGGRAGERWRIARDRKLTI
jgi:D-serine deaminase-like pyridoxal phosphate-dependent protein